MQDKAIVTEAKNNYKIAVSLHNHNLPKLGNRYDFFRNQMENIIGECQSTSQAIYAVQEKMIFDTREKISKLAPLLSVYEELLGQDYPHFKEEIINFFESDLLPPNITFKYKGRLVTTALYFQLSNIFACLTYARTIENICEIGGGLGCSARLWMTNPIQNINRYTIVDIPESLFFAELFLKKTLTDATIIYVQPGFRYENYSETSRAIFLCPIAQAGIIEGIPFDCITGVASFQEMNDDWLMFWSDWLERQKANFFYAHNFFGNSVENIFESENIFAPLVPVNWELKYYRTHVPTSIIQSLGIHCAEMFFERQENPVTVNPEVNGRARLVFNELKSEKFGRDELLWFSYNLLHARDFEIEIGLIKKIVDDFDYFPAELLFLIRRVVNHKNFKTNDNTDFKYIKSLHENLENTRKAAGPAPTHEPPPFGLVRRILKKLPSLFESMRKGRLSLALIFFIWTDKESRSFKLWPWKLIRFKTPNKR